MKPISERKLLQLAEQRRKESLKIQQLEKEAERKELSASDAKTLREARKYSRKNNEAQLKEDTDRQRFFNEMRRRDF